MNMMARAFLCRTALYHSSC